MFPPRVEAGQNQLRSTLGRGPPTCDRSSGLRLPEDLRTSPLVKEQRALALSNAGDHDMAIGALRELIQTSGDTAERRGLLGGRYKKKWGKSGDAGDLNSAIAEYEAGMKLDLNNYYPPSNLARLYRTRIRKGDEDRARILAAVTLTAVNGPRLANRTMNGLILPCSVQHSTQGTSRKPERLQIR